jgi:3-oxoacyl-[acyl-carrier protein] reductase
MNQTPITYVVIGAAGGVGSALAEILLKSNHRVIRGVRKMDDFNHPSSATIEVDATSMDSVDNLFQEAESLAGPIYGTALCVGSIIIRPAHLTKEEEFDRTIALNLKSAFAVVRSASRKMMKMGGSIVLVSSCAALKGIPNHEAIASAKAGVVGLAQSAAATYAHHGIRVNCVAPGLTRSKMSAGIVNNEAALKASSRMHPLGRIGEPDEVARAIAWFLNPEQGWVTGQVLGIDGGLANLGTMPRA